MIIITWHIDMHMALLCMVNLQKKTLSWPSKGYKGVTHIMWTMSAGHRDCAWRPEKQTYIQTDTDSLTYSHSYGTLVQNHKHKHFRLMTPTKLTKWTGLGSSYRVSSSHVCISSSQVRWHKNHHLTNSHLTNNTHPFNGPFSGTTQVSQYQKGKTNLDFTEARESEWQWHQLGHMQVYTLLQTDNHTSTPQLCFLQAGCPSCRPTNSVKALKPLN